MKEMIIGRLGDQKLVITEKSVSRYHCKITLLPDGGYFIEDIGSKFGTWVNGKRITSAKVGLSDVIGLGSTADRLGPGLTVRLSELIIPKETVEYSVPQPQPTPPTKEESPMSFNFQKVSKYSHYRDVLKDYKRLGELERLYDAVKARAAEVPSHLLPSIQCAIACKHLKGGKVADAQRLIYQAGDTVFQMQDGSSKLEGCYATMMTLLSDLYLTTFNYAESELAGQYAVGIFNRWKPGDKGIDAEVVAEAFERYGDALAANDKKPLAARCYERAIDLYRQCGSSQPELYSVMIQEVEKKIRVKGLNKSGASMAANFPACATCAHWCGHTEPNSICTVVHYTPGECAQCTKTFRGSQKGKPAEQSCSNWEQRYKDNN